MPWIHCMEDFLFHLIEVCIIIMEGFGVCVIIITGVYCFIRWLRKDQEIGLRLARGIALALEFKLGGEVLRTVIARTWAELGILGATIVLRGLVTILIHWEIGNERKHIAERKAEERAALLQTQQDAECSEGQKPETEGKASDLMFR